MKPVSSWTRQEIISGVLIAIICVLVFIVAMLAVPKISHATGVSEDTVSYGVGILVFLFTIWMGLFVKSKIER
jgi:Ca2+/Na+ antiporter